ncbi:MAG: lipopolysaccharide heptosyltransferase II [Bryobacteraceae bacterium]
MVRATNWVGDAVMSLPALQALRERYPAARISILARRWVADLYAREPFCDDVIAYQAPSGWEGLGAKWAVATDLRSRHFDGAILLQNAFEAAAIAWLGRIPVRIGYNRDGRGALLTNAIPVPAPGEIPNHQRFYYLELLKRAGVIEGYPFTTESQLSGSEAAAAAGRAHFARLGLGGRVVGISPGAAFGTAKQWLPERFAETGIRLSRELGTDVAVFGSKVEQQLCEAVRSGISASGINCVNLAGKTTLAEFIEMAAACSLYLTNDSGAMHIASALGVPTAVVFGSTDHVATGPAGHRFAIIRQPVECSPCLLRECPIDHRCMTRVTVESVAQAALELVK